MHRAPRTSPARTIALPRPQAALEIDWIVAGLAVALLLAGIAS